VTDFLQTTINFLSLAGLYALIALGYTLVYGILRFINFAHSDVVTWGAWIAFTIAAEMQWIGSGGSPAYALPLVMVMTMALCATMGVTIERLAYRPLRRAPRLNVLITAIGVSLLLQNVGLLKDVFGAMPRSMQGLLDNQTLTTIADVPIRMLDVITIGLAVVLVVALERLVYATKMGRGMRAVSFDERTASLMGVNVNQVIAVTFAIGSALAAVGGILWALKLDLRQTADASWVLLGLKAFVAAVVGGIGNVRGAAAGAALIAFVEVFVHYYITRPFPNEVWVGQLRDIYVFAILILVLLFKPSGLFGRTSVEKV
jgi:branched-chain amino acid transport system permease protein